MLLFADDGMADRKFLGQLVDQVLITGHIVALCIRIARVIGIIIFQENNAVGLLVAKQRNRLVGRLLQIAKADNVTERFYGIQNKVY